MKAKKLVALIMSAAMVVGSASLFAACAPEEEPGNNPGNNPGSETPAFINDDNTYYAVGQSNGSDGTLYNQGGAGWAADVDDIQFEKSEVEDANINIFTLTLKMYAGDAFKVLFDKEQGWSGTMINYYSLTDAAKVYFETNNDSNIICKEGYDGIYEFTLTTDLTKTDWAEQYVLTVTQKDTVTPLPVYYKMQLAGGLVVNMENMGSGVWSCNIDVTSAMLKVNVLEDGTLEYVNKNGQYLPVYVLNAGNQYDDKVFCDAEYEKADVSFEGDVYTSNLLEEGSYTITFTEGTDGAGTVVIKKITDKWHVVLDDEVNESDDGYDLYYSSSIKLWVCSVTLTAEETKVELKNLGDSEADLVTVATLPAGKWAIAYNPDTGEVKYAVETYYVVGTFTEHTWGSGCEYGDAVALEYVDEGDGYVHYAAIVELKAGDEINILKGLPFTMAQGSYEWPAGNIKITEDGVYKVEMWTNNISGYVANLVPQDDGSEGEDAAE